MKIQNLSIIFVVIMLPLLVLLTFYINERTDTLETQESYNSKILTATKDAISAFEINSADWERTASNKARNAQTMVDTFISSLANQMGRTGITKEYMEAFIPAILVNMYDGYYVYATNYAPQTIENDVGLQLFEKTEAGTKKLVTSISNGEETNKIIYKAKQGAVTETSDYERNGVTRNYTYTTNIDDAAIYYKHYLSNKIPYAATYKTNMGEELIVNFTLDNKISVLYSINEGGEQKAVSREGYLVYFHNNSKLPEISINGNDVQISNGVKVNETKYAYEESVGGSDIINVIPIEPETLTEQIAFTDDNVISKDDNAKYDNWTFKYLYDIDHNKLYYDESVNLFFELEAGSNRRVYYYDTAGSEIKYKSVSVVLNDGDRTKYKKIYQALNGPKKGSWFIDTESNEDNIEYLGDIDLPTRNLNVQLSNQELSYLGLNGMDTPEQICKDFSAISYYVEAYAFTNWVNRNMSTVQYQMQMKYDDEKKEYKLEQIANIEEGNEIFKIGKNNNPEKESSAFTMHKKRIMQELIQESLNLAIANYNRGSNSFKIPELTYGDWDHFFENVSMLSFVQGMTVGLKDYNNYTIATSKYNREYVNPKGIYFSGADQKFHYPYCKYTEEGIYTGYRSVEYILKDFKHGSTEKIYYKHDNRTDENSELACYYCVVSPETYEPLKNGTTENNKKISSQLKSYNEALARERYDQKEKVKLNVGVTVTYHANLKEEDKEYFVKKVTWPNSIEDPYVIEVKRGDNHIIIREEPTITKWESENLNWTLELYEWNTEPDGTGKSYQADDIITNVVEDINLYGQWRLKLDSLHWHKDYYYPFLEGMNDSAKSAYESMLFDESNYLSQEMNCRGCEIIYGGENIDSHDYMFFYKNLGFSWSGEEVCGVWGDNISYIKILDDSSIKMLGNSINAGKGAVWATVNGALYNYYQNKPATHNLQVEEISFDYNIDFGDSFSAAGIIFNVQEDSLNTKNWLEGYYLSFNNIHPYDDCGAQDNNKFFNTKKRASVWKFRYIKGENDRELQDLATNFNALSTELKHICDLELGKSGTIIIKTIKDASGKYCGYEIYKNETGFTELLCTIKLDSEVAWFSPNKFGFMSSHYRHGCGALGRFGLENISIKCEYVQK